MLDFLFLLKDKLKLFFEKCFSVTRKRKSTDDLWSMAKRKRVSFGPNLSPEQFNKFLPPSTPIQKGATPRRISEPFKEVPSAKSLLKRKSLALLKQKSPIREEDSCKTSPKATKNSPTQHLKHTPVIQSKSPTSKLQVKSSPLNKKRNRYSLTSKKSPVLEKNLNLKRRSLPIHSLGSGDVSSEEITVFVGASLAGDRISPTKTPLSSKKQSNTPRSTKTSTTTPATNKRLARSNTPKSATSLRRISALKSNLATTSPVQKGMTPKADLRRLATMNAMKTATTPKPRSWADIVKKGAKQKSVKKVPMKKASPSRFRRTQNKVNKVILLLKKYDFIYIITLVA